jgi:hypothetical protein
MRLLGLIVVTIASALLLQGVALAHTSGHHDRVQAQPKTSKPPEAEAASSAYTGECHRRAIATSSEIVSDTPSGVGRHDAAGDWNARNDGEPGDDCCGVACHAAVEGRDDDRLASYARSKHVDLAVTSELLGARQGRPERPPRHS